MRTLELVAGRLGRPDMAQALLLVLAVLVMVLGFAWPSGGTLVNESWFSLSPARNALLALAAAAFGAAQGVGRPHADESGVNVASNWRPEARSTLGALMVWMLLTLPLEVVSHAASYPAINLGWAVLVGVVTVPAYYGLGMLLRLFTQMLRVGWLLPVVVPAAVVGFAWLDLRLDSALFNPWTAALSVSVYPVVTGAATLATVVALFAPRSWRRPAVTAEPDEAER